MNSVSFNNVDVYCLSNVVNRYDVEENSTKLFRDLVSPAPEWSDLCTVVVFDNLT